MASKLRAIKVREAAEITPLTTEELKQVATIVQADWDAINYTVGTCGEDDLAKGLVEGDDEIVIFLPIFSAAIKEQIGPELTNDALAGMLMRLLEERFPSLRTSGGG